MRKKKRRSLREATKLIDIIARVKRKVRKKIEEIIEYDNTDDEISLFDESKNKWNRLLKTTSEIYFWTSESRVLLPIPLPPFLGQSVRDVCEIHGNISEWWHMNRSKGEMHKKLYFRLSFRQHCVITLARYRRVFFRRIRRVFECSLLPSCGYKSVCDCKK